MTSPNPEDAQYAMFPSQTTGEHVPVPTDQAPELAVDPRDPIPAGVVPVVAPEGQSPQETEAKGEFVQGMLVGRPVLVPPTKKWRMSALSALRDGDIDGWAKETLTDDGWEVWVEVNPTVEEVEKFFADLNPKLGTNPGNSRRSRTSSPRTHPR